VLAGDAHAEDARSNAEGQWRFQDERFAVDAGGDRPV
jgi:hypothetical protein